MSVDYAAHRETETLGCVMSARHVLITARLQESRLGVGVRVAVLFLNRIPAHRISFCLSSAYLVLSHLSFENVVKTFVPTQQFPTQHNITQTNTN